MKINKSQLKQIIKEEMQDLQEFGRALRLRQKIDSTSNKLADILGDLRVISDGAQEPETKDALNDLYGKLDAVIYRLKQY